MFRNVPHNFAESLRIKNDRPIQKKGRSDVSIKSNLVLKLRRSEPIARRGLDGFFGRFGVYFIALDDDFS